MDPTPPTRSSRLGHAVWLALAVGLALRAFEAATASLWLDELHTLVHASQPSFAAVIASVADEVHTPLFFLFVHLFGAFEEGAALRAIPVVSSLLVVWPLLRITRAAGAGARAATLAVWLYACLPYQVHWGSELRPYAWTGLLSAAAFWIAFRGDGSRVSRFVLFFGCVLLGLYTHRIMAVTVFAVVVARLVVRRPEYLGLGWLLLAAGLAVGPFVPWLVSFAGSATEARLDYQESVGGYTLRPQLAKEVLALPVRVFVPFTGALGAGWSTLARGAAVLFFGALGLGLAQRLRVRPAPLAPIARGLSVFVLVDFVLVSALALWTWDRVPLQYYVPLAWGLPLLVAWALEPIWASRLGRAAGATVAVSVLALGVAQAGGESNEDMRSAVARARAIGAALERQGEPPLFTALLSQPDFFEHRLPYLAYGADLGAVEPDALPGPGQPGFERPLVLLRRGRIARDKPGWAEVTAGREVVLEEEVDFYLSVLVLRPGP